MFVHVIVIVNDNRAERKREGKSRFCCIYRRKKNGSEIGGVSCCNDPQISNDIVSRHWSLYATMCFDAFCDTESTSVDMQLVFFLRQELWGGGKRDRNWNISPNSLRLLLTNAAVLFSPFLSTIAILRIYYYYIKHEKGNKKLKCFRNKSDYFSLCFRVWALCVKERERDMLINLIGYYFKIVAKFT